MSVNNSKTSGKMSINADILHAICNSSAYHSNLGRINKDKAAISVSIYCLQPHMVYIRTSHTWNSHVQYSNDNILTTSIHDIESPISCRNCSWGSQQTNVLGSLVHWLPAYCFQSTIYRQACSVYGTQHITFHPITWSLTIHLHTRSIHNVAYTMWHTHWGCIWGTCQSAMSKFITPAA